MAPKVTPGTILKRVREKGLTSLFHCNLYLIHENNKKYYCSFCHKETEYIIYDWTTGKWYCIGCVIKTFSNFIKFLRVLDGAKNIGDSDGEKQG